MKNKGITLIELIVVITVIGILIVALGFEFREWISNYKVESGIKEMYVDMMNARARAMQMNRLHVADFPTVTATSTEYRIREDTNEDSDPAVVAGDTVLPTFPKTVQYVISRSGGAITAPFTISFDTRGIIQPTTAAGTTLCMSNTAEPDYDCIVISPTRINMGKLTTSIPEGGQCDDTNCVAR